MNQGLNKLLYDIIFVSFTLFNHDNISRIDVKLSCQSKLILTLKKNFFFLFLIY